jgi:hypothetical protein
MIVQDIVKLIKYFFQLFKLYQIDIIETTGNPKPNSKVKEWVTCGAVDSKMAAEFKSIYLGNN